MSIDTDIKRIADALERIADRYAPKYNHDQGPPLSEDDPSGFIPTPIKTKMEERPNV